MKHEVLPPCKNLAELLEKVNRGKLLDQGEQERLHVHLLDCGECRGKLNEKGRKVLYP